MQWLLIVVLVGGLCLAAPSAVSGQSTLIFGDEFDSLNMTRWKHEITMGGGGNWEFESACGCAVPCVTRDTCWATRPA